MRTNSKKKKIVFFQKLVKDPFEIKTPDSYFKIQKTVFRNDYYSDPKNRSYQMEILNGYNAIRIDDYPQRQCRNAILYSVANFHFLFELKGRSERRGQWENKFKKPNLQQRRIELYILHK